MTDQNKGIGGFPSNVHLNQVQDPSVGECYLMYTVQIQVAYVYPSYLSLKWITFFSSSKREQTTFSFASLVA